MGLDTWTVQDLSAYKSRAPDEIGWLWSTVLPKTREGHPAAWDSIVGFFEDAIVASCTRPGKLVVTPRELLKQLKHNGREPASGMKIIEELFQRGDIVRADSLKPPSQEKTTVSSYSLSSIRSSLSSYIWGGAKESLPALDDPIVPMAALKAVSERAASLSGPMASAEIHTVNSFASAITGGNSRDAEAVIAHIVSKGDAAALFTASTGENPEPVFGVKLGKGKAQSSDTGVLRTKAALEHMAEMGTHLEEAVETEKAAAVEAAKNGNKSEALARLRKKKVLETKLAGARSASSKLSEVLMAVDEAESNREAVVALETGMASLKVVTQDGVTADRVDAVAADFEDMLADQQDVRLAFEQLNADSAENDATLLAELDELVPSKVGVEKPAVHPDVDLDAELAELLQGLPMPSPHKGENKRPESATDAASAVTTTAAVPKGEDASGGKPTSPVPDARPQEPAAALDA